MSDLEEEAKDNLDVEQGEHGVTDGTSSEDF
jgi:hypothetical protein